MKVWRLISTLSQIKWTALLGRFVITIALKYHIEIEALSQRIFHSGSRLAMEVANHILCSVASRRQKRTIDCLRFPHQKELDEIDDI
jgi:hypothetical protein